jgi:hypothetical protein
MLELADIKAALTKRPPKGHTQHSIQQDATHPRSSSDFNFELSEMLRWLVRVEPERECTLDSQAMQSPCLARLLGALQILRGQ